MKELHFLNIADAAHHTAQVKRQRLAATCKGVAILALSGCIALLSVVGCTSKGWYQSIQQTNTRDCEKLPASEQDECLERSAKSYEEYQREREGSAKS